MKTKEYKYIEYTDDDDFVIANVVMDDDKIVSVKLTESCLTNQTGFVELRRLLEEINSLAWKYGDSDESCSGWWDIDLTSINANTVNS